MVFVWRMREVRLYARSVCLSFYVFTVVAQKHGNSDGHGPKLSGCVYTTDRRRSVFFGVHVRWNVGFGSGESLGKPLCSGIVRDVC